MKINKIKEILIFVLVLTCLVFQLFIFARTKDIEKESLKQQSISADLSENIITRQEIAKYLTGVVVLHCDRSQGSGSLWDINGLKYVLTNKHVIKSHFRDGICVVESFDNMGKSIGIYTAIASSSFNVNAKGVDLSLASIYSGEDSTSSVDVYSLNYSISDLSECPSVMPIGSPVVAVGFPSDADGYTRIVSNGVISGYSESTTTVPTIPDYYVSNKLDSGNSGGITMSKYNGTLCLLGVPTWMFFGDYDSQGIVQNIYRLKLK